MLDGQTEEKKEDKNDASFSNLSNWLYGGAIYWDRELKKNRFRGKNKLHFGHVELGMSLRSGGDIEDTVGYSNLKICRSSL